jgi:purine-binding chemotaxis protein CheW
MSLPVNAKEQDPAMVEESQGDEGQFLTFTLGKEMFAIGILNIKEILEYGQLTSVPMMPEFIRGVINLRGSVVPVVDLRARFGDKQADITKRTCIVIIEVTSEDERQDIGVVVDTVSEVLEIPETEIEPPPAFGAKIRADFIAGMGKVNGDFVIILDVEKVLSVDELAMVSQVSEMAEA